MNKQCFRILATHSMQLGTVRWNPALTDIVVQDGSSTTPAKEEIHLVLPCLIGIDASFHCNVAGRDFVVQPVATEHRFPP
jgi:hypothetical protein